MHQAHRALRQPGDPGDYWSHSANQVLQSCDASAGGLTQREGRTRLKVFSLNSLVATQGSSVWSLALGQFKSPLVLILIVASGISMLATEWVNALVVLTIVLGSTLLGFSQEYVANHAINQLRSRIKIRSRVLRDGQIKTLPSEHLVRGDVVVLSAGSLIPADGVVLSARDFLSTRPCSRVKVFR